MKRKLPKELEKASESIKADSIKPTNERIHQTRKYKVITPLFGGGIVARENDPSKLIRETSVRGQLRFWWRAMRATGSLKDIYERENFIFGSGGKKAAKSNVSIAVKITSQGQSEDIFRIENRRPKPNDKWSKIAYAAFALQPTTEELKAGGNVPLRKVRVGVEFTLEISYPNEFEADVQAALWAWETFGGIGGRTRRGFGALELLEVTENGKPVEVNKYKVEKVEQQIKNDLQKYLLPNKNPDTSQFPQLSANTNFKIKAAGDATEAWKYAIEKLKNFRQVRNVNSQTRRPGRNKWPEPDELRRIFLKYKKGAILRHQPISRLDKFPRGEFGLPIIFHFQREEGIQNDFTLQGVKSEKIERLASPLILRPLHCHNGAVSLALILNAPRIPKGGLEVYYGKAFSVMVNSQRLTKNEADVLTKNGLGKQLAGKTDVLQAFLEFFAL